MKRRRDLWLLIPSFAGLIVFFIVPFLISICYAFTDNIFTRDFAGLRTFGELFKNEYFLLAMKNTGYFTLAAVPLSMFISLVVAVFTARVAPNSFLLKAIYFLPVILPSAALIALWRQLFPDFPAFLSLILIYLVKYSGLNIMLMLNAMALMNKDMLESARLDGAGYLRIARSIILPNLLPTLFFTLILSLVNSLKVFRESFLLYGNYPDESVYLLQNFLNNHFDKLNYHYISAAAIIVALIVYALVAVLFRAERKRSAEIW